MQEEYHFRLDLIFIRYLRLMQQYNVDEYIVHDFIRSFELIKTLPKRRTKNWIYRGLTRKETFFKQLINLPDGEFYEIAWDIEFVGDYVRKNTDVPFGKMSISDLFHSNNDLNKKTIEQLRSDYPNFKPIIVSEYMATQQLLIIDGNHRTQVLKEKGVPTVDAYVLNESLPVNLMTDLLSQCLYLFHFNIAAIGMVDQNKYVLRNDTLTPGNYFPLVPFIDSNR
jgi:hypothetical protein